MSVSPELQKEGPLYTVKILLLGESSVGKSSLVNRYTNHTFQSNGLLTIGIEVKKIMKQMNGKKIRLECTYHPNQCGTPRDKKNIAPSLPSTSEVFKAFCWYTTSLALNLSPE
ncbi:MAG: hypothetical protein KDD45_04805 [Bdellovibrionales bacterium]|nr:hypothetical protein [Bdellovibrionales bacterium]